MNSYVYNFILPYLVNESSALLLGILVIIALSLRLFKIEIAYINILLSVNIILLAIIYFVSGNYLYDSTYITMQVDVLTSTLIIVSAVCLSILLLINRTPYIHVLGFFVLSFTFIIDHAVRGIVI